MATYKDAGVDIEIGDECSKIAYQAAKDTFKAREGRIGMPVILDGGFSGALDFGDYYLVMNDDGVGTKTDVASRVGDYSTLGYDLLAMVVDDAICIGAEVVSILNTIDVQKVEKEAVEPMMEGLKQACLEQKVTIAGGEIAEMGNMVNGIIWNASAVGIVKKDRMITGKNVKPGDKIIGLKSNMFRSNGLTLVRHILKENFGEEWHNQEYENGKTWGEVVLTPTKIYHACILEMIGRYGENGPVDIKGIAHITGGGLKGNINRVLNTNNLGAKLDKLPEPHAPMKKLQELGDVSYEEAYKTWNMGVGMVLISNEFDKINDICGKHGIECMEIGEVISENKIEF